jgi:hypothetical protein
MRLFRLNLDILGQVLLLFYTIPEFHGVAGQTVRNNTHGFLAGSSILQKCGHGPI